MPAAKKWDDGNGWNYASKFGGPPDLIVKSPNYTQKAVAMDAWYKPVVETGLAEPRWVRAIEMRPSTLKGRKITHHALAYLMQDEKEVQAILNNADADSGAGLFMEWAVNKLGELMRPNTGKLMLPGSKIRWDIHYSAGGETSPTTSNSASTSTRRAKSRSTGQRCRSTAASPAATATSTLRRTRSASARTSTSCAAPAASRTSSRTCTSVARR